jgi:hypothetical protein
MDNKQLTEEFRAFLESLTLCKADYMLVGGYAVGLHGHVRATSDIAIWVGYEAANARKVLNAIEHFAGTRGNLTEANFSKPSSIVFMGIEPFRLDVFTTIPGVEFKDCLTKALVMKLDGLDVRVIDLEGLIQNKIASGRDTDLVDVRKLREH